MVRKLTAQKTLVRTGTGVKTEVLEQSAGSDPRHAVAKKVSRLIEVTFRQTWRRGGNWTQRQERTESI